MSNWKKRMQALGAGLWKIVPDALAVVGAVCVTYGATMIFPPAGWIVGGVLCVIAGALMSGGDDG